MNKGKTVFISVLIAAITGLHYFTTAADAPLDEFYRELYFLPALLAGLWGGKKRGLTASVIISLLFLPHVVHTMGTTLSAFLVNIFEVMLFNLTGLLAGMYRDAKQGYLTTLEIPYAPTEVKKSFLLLIDGTPFSLYAANYLARMLGKVPDVGVTLLWVLAGQDTELFESPEAVSGYDREEYRKGEKILKQAKEILLGGGIPERNIQVRVSTADKKSRISDKILEEVGKGDYDTIVVGKHPRTKAEELLFGSTTISLVRGAPISVMAVKMPPGEGKPGEA